MRQERDIAGSPIAPNRLQGERDRSTPRWHKRGQIQGCEFFRLARNRCRCPRLARKFRTRGRLRPLGRAKNWLLSDFAWSQPSTVHNRSREETQPKFEKADIGLREHHNLPRSRGCSRNG